jgi:hypothetical protein
MIGTLILTSTRHIRRLPEWIAVSAACITVYAYHYKLPSQAHGAPLSNPIHPNLMFIVTFIGNAAELPTNTGFLGIGLIVCPLLGLMLCTFFLYAARTGYFNKNRAVSYCILFLLTTAVGVGSMRSDLGVRQSMSSRYGLYSTLLLIFAWFVVAEKLHHADCYSALKSRGLQVAVTAAVLFSVVTDVAGYRYIVSRNQELIDSMAAYKNSGGTMGPVSPLPNQPSRFTEEQRHAPEILKGSIRIGIYRPYERKLDELPLPAEGAVTTMLKP